MSDEMRINLRGMDEWNAICYFSDDEQEVIDQYLDEVKEDTDYYNVVLDFSDCDKLQNIIHTIPDNNMKKAVLYNVYEQYLYYKIIKAANLENEIPIEETGEVLFSDTIRSLYETGFLYWEDIADALKKKAKDNSNRGIARIHLPLDSVANIEFQQAINFLFIWRGKISMVGYTTKKLLNYYTNNGTLVQSNGDYISLKSDKKQEEDTIELENKRKKFMI
nr:hypothetical protein [Bacilli bacterium]